MTHTGLAPPLSQMDSLECVSLLTKVSSPGKAFTSPNQNSSAHIIAKPLSKLPLSHVLRTYVYAIFKEQSNQSQSSQLTSRRHYAHNNRQMPWL